MKRSVIQIKRKVVSKNVNFARFYALSMHFLSDMIFHNK